MTLTLKNVLVTEFRIFIKKYYFISCVKEADFTWPTESYCPLLMKCLVKASVLKGVLMKSKAVHEQ